MRSIIYESPVFFKYFLVNGILGQVEVTEDEFFRVVGFNRRVVPMHYDSDNINRQNFYMRNGELVGYRER